MILQELRYSFRSLQKKPGFAMTAIFMLALGIGATTAIFTVIDALFLKSLPYPPEADRIVIVREVTDKGRKPALSEPNFHDLQTRSKSFEPIVHVSGTWQILVSAGTESERSKVRVISEGYLDLMKVRPHIGRTFTPEEERYGGPKAALISEQYRQRILGGRNDIHNVKINVDGVICNVVGVLPAAFNIMRATDIWIPLGVARGLEPENLSRTAHNWPVMGRLRKGISLEQAQADVTAIAKDLRRTYGKETDAIDFSLVPLQTYLTSEVKQALLLLFGATALLLLIACANYSNLLLARLTSRQTEFSIRTSLGASGFKIMRQAVVENLLTALPAAALGSVIAYLSVKLILSIDDGSLPRFNAMTIDGRAILFCILSAILISILTAILPALRIVRSKTFNNLIDKGRGNSEGKSKRTGRSLMVVTQIALTFILLSGTGLLIHSFIKVMQVDPGFKTESTLVMKMSLPTSITKEEDERHRQFYSQLRERIKNLPGVTASGNINALPLDSEAENGTFLINDDPSKSGEADYKIASTGYFEAIKTPLLSGRLFNNEDTANSHHVAVINQSLAKKYWPNKNPIGERIQFGNMDTDKRLLHIVGIVGDTRDSGLENAPPPMIFANSVQRPQWWQSAEISFVIHTQGDPQSLTGSLRSIVKELRPGTPVSFRTMDELFRSTFDDRRFNLVLFSSFAFTALLIAAMGLYGVLSYTVEQRTKEIGIRTALGAEKKNIVSMIMRYGVMLALGGGVIGIVATVALSRFMKGMLFGVSETDVITLAVIFVVLLLTAMIACYIPARRAANVNPLVALRD